MKQLLLMCAMFFFIGTSFAQSKSTTTIYKSKSKAKSTVIPNSKGGTDVIINQSNQTPKKASGNNSKVKMHPKKKSKWDNVKMHPKKKVKMGKPKKGSVIEQ